jgi:hypothetical protein
LRYLGAYTHRVAISNRRLIALEDGNITFRWRDSAHGNKKKLMTLSVDEFLRRFLLHLLPCAFVRIRNFGFLANRRRASLLPLVASCCMLQHKTRPPLQRDPRVDQRCYGAAPDVAELCIWSNGSPRHNFCFALLR